MRALPSPRPLPASSVGPRGPVAVSCPVEPTVILDARRLMTLGCACRRTVGALCLLMRRMERECARGDAVDTGEMADIAWMTGRVEEAAELLQQMAQDAELLALLPHRERFRELARMAAEMDRGAVFLPSYPVSVASVVVVPEHDPAARRTSLRERVGQGLARLKQRAA